MNDRKRAWQILHAQIRRRSTENVDIPTWREQIRSIIRGCDDPACVIVELADFGSTFATMTRISDDPLADADSIGAWVMAQSDEDYYNEPRGNDNQ
jgi:hypothetical protein